MVVDNSIVCTAMKIYLMYTDWHTCTKICTRLFTIDYLLFIMSGEGGGKEGGKGRYESKCPQWEKWSTIPWDIHSMGNAI